MIIKIQKAITSSDGSKPFLLYNKSRTFQAEIHEGEVVYPAIDKFFNLHDKGDHKIYADAILHSDGFLELKGALMIGQDSRTNF